MDTPKSAAALAAEALIHRVSGIMGGEAVFVGTRIPAGLIGKMLAEGVDEAEILDGYPSLDTSMLDAARIWFAGHPDYGKTAAFAKGRDQAEIREVPLSDYPPPKMPKRSVV